MIQLIRRKSYLLFRRALSPGLVRVKSVSTPGTLALSGGDWRIGRVRKDQGTRRMGQPAGLKRLSAILRVKGSLVKRYLVCVHTFGGNHFLFSSACGPYNE